MLSLLIYLLGFGLPLGLQAMLFSKYSYLVELMILVNSSSVICLQ